MQTYPFTIPQRLTSPLYPVRRDWALNGGEDVQLQLTVVDSDGGSAIDMTGATVTFSMVRKGWGGPVYQKTGAVYDGATGRLNLTLSAAETLQMAGRYEYQIVVVLDDETTCQVRGALIVHGDLSEATDGDAVLTDHGDYIELGP